MPHAPRPRSRSAGHCDTFHAKDETYFKDVWYWNTPTETCLDGRGDICTDFDAWTDRPGPRSRAPDRRDRDPSRAPAADARRARAALTPSRDDPDGHRAVAARVRPPAAGQRVLHRRPRAQLAALLAAPVGWLVIAYLGSLRPVPVSSFWSVDSLTGNIVDAADPRELHRILTERGLPDDRGPDRGHGGARHADDDRPSPSRSRSTWRGSPRPAPAALCSSRSCCRCGRATSSRSTPGA